MEYDIYQWLLSDSAVHDCLLMSKNPLHVLQKGIAKLKIFIKEKRTIAKCQRVIICLYSPWEPLYTTNNFSWNPYKFSICENTSTVLCENS